MRILQIVHSRSLIKINKNLGVLLILICIIVFHIVNNYFWIKNDVLSFYHEKYYQLIAKNEVLSSIKKIIQHNAFFLEKFISIFKLTGLNFQGWPGLYWSGLYHIYTAYVNLIFGNNISVSLMANIPFFILLIIFTFLIGKKIAGKEAGILAAFFISFYPGIYGMSRSYGIDFPLTTMVTISMYILIAKDITKIKYALFFGLIMGLTLLMKLQGFFFLIGPLIYIFYQHIYKSIRYGRDGNNFNRQYIFQIVLTFCLSVLLALFLFNLGIPGWYKSILTMVKVNFDFSNGRQLYRFHNLFGEKSICFYLFEMVHSMSKLLFLFFLVSFLLFWKTKLKYKTIIYLWIFIPYIIFTVIFCKCGRYYFPVLPALALISAIGIFQINSKRYKLILVTAVIFLSLFQFYDLSFGTTTLPKILYRPPPYSFVAYPPPYSFVAYPPQKYEEEKIITHFLETINKEIKDLPRRPTILSVGLPELIDSGKLEYIFQTKELDIEFAKFFTSASNYKNCNYIIVINNKIANVDKIDLSFLKTFDYKGFLAIRYPGNHISEAELEDMYNTFIKFEVIDYYFSNINNLIFYLCKNPMD